MQQLLLQSLQIRHKHLVRECRTKQVGNATNSDLESYAICKFALVPKSSWTTLSLGSGKWSDWSNGRILWHFKKLRLGGKPCLLEWATCASFPTQALPIKFWTWLRKFLLREISMQSIDPVVASAFCNFFALRVPPCFLAASMASYVWDSWQQDRKVQSAHFALYPRRSHWYKDTLVFRAFWAKLFQQVSEARAQRLQRRVYKHTTSSRVRSTIARFMKRKRKCEFWNRRTVHLSSEAEIVHFGQGFSKHSTMVLKNTTFLLYNLI